MRNTSKKYVFVLTALFMSNVSFPNFLEQSNPPSYNSNQQLSLKSIFSQTRDKIQQDFVLFEQLSISQNKILRDIYGTKYESLIKLYYEINFIDKFDGIKWESLDKNIQEVFLYIGLNKDLKDLLKNKETVLELANFIKTFEKNKFILENIELIITIIHSTGNFSTIFLKYLTILIKTFTDIPKNSQTMNQLLLDTLNIFKSFFENFAKFIEKIDHDLAERYSTIFQTSPNAITITSIAEGKFAEVSDAFETISGYSKKEASASSSVALNLWVNPEKRKEVIITLLNGGEVKDIEVQFKRKNGSIINCSFSAKIVSINGKKFILSSILDITERKKAEQELAKFKTIAEQSNTGLAITDLAGNFIYVNPAWVKIHGYSSHEELIGQHFSIHNLPAQTERVVKAIQQLKEKGFILADEVEHTRKNGEIFPTIMDTRVIKDEKGNPLFMTSTLIDISDLKLAKRQVKEMASLLSQVSHDIRTPLNAILGSLHFLNALKLTSEAYEHISTAKFASETLLQIVEHILMYFKLKSGKLILEKTTIDIKEKLTLFSKMMEALSQKKNLEFSLIIEKNVPKYLTCDWDRLQTILLNLTTNAIKFTNKGSVKIKVSLKKEDANNVTILFQIIDTGVGLSKETLEHEEHLFEEFVQIKNEGDAGNVHKGFGLGLSIVKALIKLMNGSISVKSAGIDKGSEFAFEIPLIRESSAVFRRKSADSESSEKSEKRKIIKAKTKILIVDDESMMRKILKKLLGSMGFQNIEEATNGLEAVEICQSKSFDIIFMDCNMPRIDGNTAAKTILENSSDKKTAPVIIALTGDAMAENESETKKAGMLAFLTKPVAKKDLDKTLTKFFDFIDMNNILKNDVIANAIIEELKALKYLKTDEDETLLWQKIEYLCSVYEILTGQKINREEILIEFPNITEIFAKKKSVIIQQAILTADSELTPPFFEQYEDILSTLRGKEKDKTTTETLEFTNKGMLIWKLFKLEKLIKASILQVPSIKKNYLYKKILNIREKLEDTLTCLNKIIGKNILLKTIIIIANIMYKIEDLSTGQFDSVKLKKLLYCA